jgi:pheromone shutdown protein TraB
MLKLIGTNHLMSREAIEKIIEDFKPDVIGVELCEARAVGIFNEPMFKSKGNSVLDKITNKIKEKAQEQNLDYGSDMKTALRYAFDNEIDYVLVDMPIQKIQELFLKIPKEEQIGFQKELSEFEGELKEVDEQEVLLTMKSRYPIAFEFLINMRNLYITNQILKAKEKYPNKRILIFLGKGHTKQVELMLSSNV